MKKDYLSYSVFEKLRIASVAIHPVLFANNKITNKYGQCNMLRTISEESVLTSHNHL